METGFRYHKGKAKDCKGYRNPNNEIRPQE